jgi:hypothetical protein
LAVVFGRRVGDCVGLIVRDRPMFRLRDECFGCVTTGTRSAIATTRWRSTKGTVNMRTTRRSTALLATGVLALGGLTAACEDNGDGIDDDFEQDVEEDFDDFQQDVEDGVDEIQDELDGDPDDGGVED